jgi:hypothetical protein
VKRLFLHLVILLAAIPLASSWAEATPRASYSVIIDAGSSGSRIYLYKSLKKGATIQVEDLWGFEPKDVPGLSDFKERPNEAYNAGIVPLLHPLRAFFGGKGLNERDTTVHVLATGGLRLLDPVQSEAILGAISTGLKTTQFKVGRIGILPSELEGLLAWADLNALLGRLAPGKETLGIVEIGGASAQIAYEIKGQAVAAAKIWQLQGHSYRIVSRSFLGLGQNAARKSMIHSVGGGVDGNPCYPQGVSVADKKTSVDALTGSFDASRCKSLYLDVIRQNPDFDRALLKGAVNQSFAGIGQGNPVGPIKGSISLWKLKGSNPHDSIKVIDAACRSPWSSFQDQFGGDLVNQNQCANSIFIETLLYDPLALGLVAHQVRHMESAGGRVPSWTRGFLLLPDSQFH